MATNLVYCDTIFVIYRANVQRIFLKTPFIKNEDENTLRYFQNNLANHITHKPKLYD